ncbi:MAG: DNA methyltransferase [Gemmatimonadaceae bacterium]
MRKTDRPLELPLDEPLSHLATIRLAARDERRVSGLTHSFYRYPARFSPQFASAAITAFSKPGDIVLDPFMGGGTSIVEACRLGRIAVGSDINALAVFICRVKTTPLKASQIFALQCWADEVVPQLRYADSLAGQSTSKDHETRNLHLPNARPIRKLTALALDTLPQLPDGPTRRFGRCALLRAGQWALNGRKLPVASEAFRLKLQFFVHEMLQGLVEYQSCLPPGSRRPRLSVCSADRIATEFPFQDGRKADMVVTSPPYPGIHILYHRWQVDGRKETNAPYWISATRDGEGSSYYNMGDRRNRNSDDYFENLSKGLLSIRAAVRDGGVFAQMVAFARPRYALPRYLEAMRHAGFMEFPRLRRRMWRSVPSRAWHASVKGQTASAREVVLLHTAV